jgi:hypothetical protein
MRMATPVYHIVFDQGCWRIEYQGLHWGEFATAVEASETALRIANSRLTPSPDTQIMTGPNGEITIGEPGG